MFLQRCHRAPILITLTFLAIVVLPTVVAEDRLEQDAPPKQCQAKSALMQKGIEYSTRLVQQAEVLQEATLPLPTAGLVDPPQEQKVVEPAPQVSRSHHLFSLLEGLARKPLQGLAQVHNDSLLGTFYMIKSASESEANVTNAVPAAGKPASKSPILVLTIFLLAIMICIAIFFITGMSHSNSSEDDDFGKYYEQQRLRSPALGVNEGVGPKSMTMPSTSPTFAAAPGSSKMMPGPRLDQDGSSQGPPPDRMPQNMPAGAGRPADPQRTPQSMNRLAVPSLPLGASRHLCPGLVVPNSNECLLAVPTLRTAGLPPQLTASFDVRDLSGKAVIRAEVNAPSMGRIDEHFGGGANQGSIDQRPIVILRAAGTQGVPGNFTPGTPSRPQPLLAYCKVDREQRGQRNVYLYDARDELFAHLAKDPFRNCYVLTGGSIGLQLTFEGNFQEHAVNIWNEQRESQADTEPTTMAWDLAGTYYQLRAVSNVDVGLMLCGLLAIDHMETDWPA